MPRNNFASLTTVIGTVALVAGLAYGVSSFCPKQTRGPFDAGTMTFSELRTMLGKERGKNIKCVTCRTGSVIAPHAVDFLVEFKEPSCTKVVPAKEMPLVDLANSGRTSFPGRSRQPVPDIVRPANAAIPMVIIMAQKNGVLFRMDPPAPLRITKREVAKSMTTFEDVEYAMLLSGGQLSSLGPASQAHLADTK